MPVGYTTPPGSALAPVFQATEKMISSVNQETPTLDDGCGVTSPSDLVEQNIQVLMKGALAAVMERQTEKTVVALQALIERRLEEMAKRILQAEERSSQGLVALQRALEESRSSSSFHELLDQRAKEITLCIDEVAQHWTRNLDHERQARQEAFEACARDIALLQDQATPSEPLSASNNSISARALKELDAAATVCFEQVAQLVERMDRIEDEFELQKKSCADTSAATAKSVEGIEEKISMGFAVEQHERRALRLELQQAEAQFAQTWQTERKEATDVIQQGVSQLHSVLASVALREKNRIDAQMLQQEFGNRLDDMQSAVARLEAASSRDQDVTDSPWVDELISNTPRVGSLASAEENLSALEQRMESVLAALHVAEEGCKQCQSFNSECEARQKALSKALSAANLPSQDENKHEFISELKSLQEDIHAIEGRCSARCRDELSTILLMVEAQEERLIESQNSEQMQAISKEIRDLKLNQESFAEASYDKALSQEAQIKIRTIVCEYTNSLSDALNFKLQALHDRFDEVIQSCRTSREVTPHMDKDHLDYCERRRGDPEPEPELIDLRRLESHQQESRFALEELQQQILEIQQRETLGREALLCTNKELLRSSSQEQSVKELHARLDAISAESARCSDSQTLFNSELADMCNVLRNMNGKVSELSGMASLPSMRSNSSRVESDIVRCVSGRVQELVNRQSRRSESPNAQHVISQAPPCTNAGASPDAANSPATRYGVPPLRLTRMSQQREQ